MSALDAKLAAALSSREQRQIRRRLPDPTSSSDSSSLIDFSTNDYLSFSSSPMLRDRFLSVLSEAPDILGSGGSRLLVNGQAHNQLEARLAHFFGSPTALLFNSGFDANAGFFACIPQQGDVVVYDEYIHASVHDGVRASRAKNAQFSFSHNCIISLRKLLLRLIDERPSLADGTCSLFLAVESLYSMDGTFAPLAEIVELFDQYFPRGNAHLVVDEAHATGIYGPQGRGRVAQLGLEDKVLARLHTFGKALAATGAVLLTNILIRDYLLNYARPLIYTTSLSNANIIAASCSFDMLENGLAHKLANDLFGLVAHFHEILRPRLASIPQDLLALPSHLQHPLQGNSSGLLSPIIPIMTSQPRPLSAYLLNLGMNARPITWPTVPKGKDRVRVCLHAGNTRQDVEMLAEGMLNWAESVLLEAKQKRKAKLRHQVNGAFTVLLESKL
ncbi:hypothetical protein PLEOSDRAFT_33042 [Pleurotus ostreatus PC15]|uniref:Aminotransferase class I/classII large domain-containing protein n=1 Tax=Pleurotus ostreatus (strain PC15) TaxID=1137138 RepID=A0A067NMH9_PLEO1|nr:hypothetical protein PLEOSDRAFT_33042 [Pleurotus ostreatus PC15]